MKKSILFLLIITACFSSCNNGTENVLINENISIRLPSDYIVTEEGDIKTFEAKIDEDNIKVSKVLLNLQDTLNTQLQKQYFITNVNSFIQTFDFLSLDTTFNYSGTHFQCDVKFDYHGHDIQNKFYGRFFAYNKDFIAICYHMKNPNNTPFKDKLFTSIRIK